jgi:hypothetical protein
MIAISVSPFSVRGLFSFEDVFPIPLKQTEAENIPVFSPKKIIFLQKTFPFELEPLEIGVKARIISQ